jgi:7-carboxy-7-deazaguanine synthase
MKLVEEFASIQGEGKFLGVPSYFLRTTGCNLRCSWKNPDGTTTICDTPYTSFEPEKGYDLDLEKTMDKIGHKIKHVIITGGEPTLQADLEEVTNYLLKEFIVTIETNSTRYVKGIERAFISASPKLKSSYAIESKRLLGMHARNNNFKEVLKQWIESRDVESRHDYQVKFVVNGEEDLNEILELQEEIGIASADIYLMPQGIDSEMLRSRSAMIFEMCMKYGFNFTPRLHIDLFGNKRGT